MHDHVSTCVDFGALFSRAAEERWKVRCFPSWKNVNPIKSSSKSGNAELDRLRRENASLKAIIASFATPVKTTEIPPEMLRMLIMLSHPDKHGGSRAATNATQWLLSQRKPK